MSGDLEDFLRRAAQRRQAKSAQAEKPAAASRPRQRPQYSNSRTERVVRTVDDEAHDEVLAATVVEDSNSLSNRRKKLEAAQAEAARAQAETAEKLKKVKQASGKGGAVAAALTGDAGESLLAALKSPNGLRQAILLREIIDRPTHRW